VHPAVPRERDERAGERDVVAELAAQRDRVGRDARAVAEAMGDVQLGRILLEQRGALDGGRRCACRTTAA
jgi:hypothetical protein